MRSPRVWCAALVAALAAPVTAQAAFQPLGDLPGGVAFSAASSVSADGTIVAGLSESTHQEGFVWTAAGGMQGLGAFGSSGYTIRAEGVANDGTVVGLAVPTPTSYGAAFAWQAGAIRDVGDLPGGETSGWAWDISETGVIVGTGISGTGEEAFRADGDTLVGLGVLPGGPFEASAGWGVSADGAVVVGRSRGANGWEAFRWTPEGGVVGLGALPNGDFPCSEARAASADGAVVVGLTCSPGGGEPFRWTAEGGMVGLGQLPGSAGSSALGVSADGTVIVGVSREAFVWTEADGLRALKGDLEAQGLDLTGWTLLSADDVSADGTVIVGAGTNPMGDTEAFRAVLPRASTDGEPVASASGLRLTVAPIPATGHVTLTVALARAASVRLEVLDALGRVVARPFNGELGPGAHAVPFDTSGLGAGLYIVRLGARARSQSARLIIVR